MSQKRKARVSGPPTALSQRQPRAMTPYIRSLLDRGHLRMQRWDAHNWQLALDQGEDPDDERSILHGGTPSDAATYAPAHHEAPDPKAKADQTKAALAATTVDKLAVLRLLARGETLRKAAEPHPTRVVRDPATGDVVVERR